jgi:hypothetical protein
MLLAGGTLAGGTIAGGALATTGCTSNTPSVFEDASAPDGKADGAPHDGGPSDVTQFPDQYDFCCNASPDPCCPVNNCDAAMNPACACELAGEDWTYEADGSVACSVPGDGGKEAGGD